MIYDMSLFVNTNKNRKEQILDIKEDFKEYVR